MEVRYSEPYRPNGRGLIEWMLGFTDHYFAYFPGFFADDTLANRQMAQQKGCMTFEKLQAEVAGYVQDWNTSAQGGGVSPLERYQTTPRQSLPAPSPLHLAVLAGGVKQFQAAANDDGLRYNNQWFVPVEKTAETYHLLALAEARRRQIAQKKRPGKDEGKIPMLQVPMLDGTYCYFASFDGHHLTPMELKTPTSFRGNTHSRHVRGMTNLVQQRAAEPESKMREVYKEVFGTEWVGVVPGREVTVEPLTAEQVQAADEQEKQRQTQIRAGKKGKTGGAGKKTGTKSGRTPAPPAAPATSTRPTSPATAAPAHSDELDLLAKYLQDAEEETL